MLLNIFFIVPTTTLSQLGLPDENTKRRIFGIHTSRMTLADDVNVEVFVMAKDDLSGADIKVMIHSSLPNSVF